MTNQREENLYCVFSISYQNIFRRNTGATRCSWNRNPVISAKEILDLRRFSSGEHQKLYFRSFLILFMLLFLSAKSYISFVSSFSCVLNQIYLYLLSFIYIFIYLYLHLFTSSFSHICIYSFHIFISSFIRILVYSHLHLFISSFIYIFVYSYLHLFIS
jgi:hypothetical protein